MIQRKRGRREEPVAVESSEDEYEKIEDDRQKDLEERDAFADRLKEKDKEKQRNVMSKSEKKVNFSL